MATFEELIKQTVKNKKPSKKYSVPKKSGDLKIAAADVKSFKDLFTKKPNAGVGNGEVSLFWLFGKGSGHEGGGKADLVLNGKNCEVKSYPKHDTMTLGKFKDDKAALELLSYLFSFNK